MQKLLIVTLLTVFSAIAAYAQLEAADQEAMQKTIELLNNKDQREAAANHTEKGRQADAFAKKVGGEHTDEIYQLSAKVFEKMVKKYNGDAKKMAEVLEEAQRNPSAFANSEFTAEELAALKALAQKLQPVAPDKK